MFSISKIEIVSVTTGYHVYRVRPNVGSVCGVHKNFQNLYDNLCLDIKHPDLGIIGHVPAQPIHLNRALHEVMDLSESIEIKCEIIGTPTAAYVPWISNLRPSGVVIPCQYHVTLASLMVPKAMEILEEYFDKDLTSRIVKCIDQFTPPSSPTKMWQPDSPDWKSMTP